MQPQVVTKLVEGRKKRVKMLNQALDLRKKDIDQRSAETCAINSTQLETFQKKAITNCKNAEVMTKSATDKLKELLKTMKG